MSRYDALGNSKTKTGTALFISDKRGKDIGKMIFWNTATGIMDFKNDLAACCIAGSRKTDCAWQRDGVDGICGIAQEIQNYFF